MEVYIFYLHVTVLKENLKQTSFLYREKGHIKCKIQDMFTLYKCVTLTQDSINIININMIYDVPRILLIYKLFNDVIT